MCLGLSEVETVADCGTDGLGTEESAPQHSLGRKNKVKGEDRRVEGVTGNQ